ncbi:diacylglycerol/polyprenol kinase family protein [Candidatus Midichloria mitochondrii]|nr:hypothetical protein [Candidatus Midichloria mitochondrii]
MMVLILLFTSGMFFFEWSRFSTGKIHYITQDILNFLKIDINKIIRPHEITTLTGASYMAIAMFITLLFFPKFVFIIAFSILAVSDSLAALVGLKFGKIQLLDKTLEGCLAFFLSAIVISYAIISIYGINHMSLFAILLTCFITACVELFAKKIEVDDNLLIPLIFCISASIFY